MFVRCSVFNVRCTPFFEVPDDYITRYFSCQAFFYFSALFFKNFFTPRMRLLLGDPHGRGTGRPPCIALFGRYALHLAGSSRRDPARQVSGHTSAGLRQPPRKFPGPGHADRRALFPVIPVIRGKKLKDGFLKPAVI